MQYKQSKYRVPVLKVRRGLALKLAVYLAAILLPIAGTVSTAYASGDAHFSLSSGGGTTVGDTFTVTVSETSTSGDAVNAVQANISYPTAQLQYQGYTQGVFTLCGQTPTAGAPDDGCATTGSESGTQTVVTFAFSVIGSGSGSVSMASGSDINSGSNGGASVWDGTLTSASYSFSAASSGSSGGGGSSSGSSGGSSESSSGSSKASSTAKTSTPSSSTPSTTTTTPAKTTTPTTSTSSGASTTTPLDSVLSIAVDTSSGQPIVGAKVTIDNKYTAYTNAQGYAAFSDVASGSHNVTVAKSGQTSSKSFSVSAGQSKTVSLKLASEKTSGGSDSLLYIAAGVVVLVAAAGFGYMKFLRPKAYTAPRPQGMVVGSGTAAATSMQPIQPPAPTMSKPAIPTGPATQTQVVTPTTNNPPSVGTEVSAPPPTSGSGQNPGNPPTVG